MFNRVLTSSAFQSLVRNIVIDGCKALNDSFIESEATRIANNYRKNK